MRYSCFDARAGHYRVFEDSVGLPVNGDLPTPSLPPDVNEIGVPAGDALRPLPRGARAVGTSWFPVGVIVRCDHGRALDGVGELELGQTAKTFVGFVMAITGAYLFYRITK